MNTNNSGAPQAADAFSNGNGMPTLDQLLAINADLPEESRLPSDILNLVVGAGQSAAPTSTFGALPFAGLH